MRKLLMFLLSLSLLFVVGCSQTVSTSGSGEEDEWGIILSAEDVTPTGMTLVCTQSGGKPTGELQTGSPYVIEQLMNGEWLPVPTAPGILDWAWTMEGWMIRPDSTTKWDVNWDFLYGELGPGLYRIQKEIMDFRGPGDFTERAYYADFAIID